MKKNSIIKKRLNTINKIIVVVLLVIFVKILFMTTIRNSHYSELANQKTYKQILVQAPRGEIKDRNGVVLAGNKPEFAVQIVADSFNKLGENEKEGPNRIAYSIINILERNGEKYTDEFPIIIDDGKYYFTFDKKIRDFKSENGIPMNYSPKKCFYYVVDSLIKNDVLSISDRNLDPVKLQSKMNSLGYYPPILVKDWKFTEQKNKEDWLSSYSLDSDITAKDAFEKIRKDYYKIDKTLSDGEARKIMLVRDLLKSKRYTQYNPVTLAKGIKKETVAQIEENAMELSGVSVAVEQKRVYPEGNLAAHVLGYVGKIPSSKAEDLKNNGYEADDLIGLSGIEHSYEDKLKGKPGYKEVKVDSVGRVIDEMKSVSPVSGNSVQLTLDSKLQKVAEKSLEDAIEAARTGNTFKSQFGDIAISERAPNAKSGAIVAIDVKNGDVLSMASFPNYDPNKFAGGITSKDYNNYLPKNKNDFLAPNPLLNLATQGAFQPGSTFKLITAMAALDSGLDPGYTINDPGVIRLGGRNFADYIWHHGGKNHGVENLYKAIQESCNIYFYVIGSDRNWMTGQNLNLGMGAKKILEYAKKFGLNEGTGLENQLEERNGKVPSEEQKAERTKIQLKMALERRMKTHFKDISYEKDRDEYEKKIDEIVSWIDEEKTPGRKETIKRLGELGVKEEDIESDADFMVYSYFNFAKWGTGDTFNLAIGQGENAYNPSQVVRYIAAIANGGNLVKMNVVDKVEDPKGKVTEKTERKSEKIKFKDSSNLKDLTEGMVRVSRDGLAKKAFGNFPVTVASKTGTAEKSGKIPSDNEFEYLLSHLDSYSVKKDELMEKYKELKFEKERALTNEKINELKEKIKNKKTSKEDRKKYEEELNAGVRVKLEDTDKINAFYLRKAIKALNPNITDSDIDRFKPDYGSFAWCVAFAPADDPQIAVACVIPQGESSSYAVLPIREVLGQYFGLLKEEKDEEKDKEENKDMKKEDIKEDKNTDNNSEKKNSDDNKVEEDDRTRDLDSDIEGID
ncbi:penicillin-binding protein 2 [Peptostreptococcus russellii]|uniref:Penicillin-binding protein 2 n=1 Tax=Peptostreptococcus russellii TaxID=215200 RepID=A0A1H8FNS4_9FIRM|nr:penicillin-binding transpeptidase domain-containing protein [Peptostreptococcus russellii]SEN33353.1 penicillin-binding protein 2 [Peptostreptococcus russellii]